MSCKFDANGKKMNNNNNNNNNNSLMSSFMTGRIGLNGPCRRVSGENSLGSEDSFVSVNQAFC